MHKKLATAGFLTLAAQSALAQGITNPAGGGVIPVAVQIFFGYWLLAYVGIALAIKHRTDKARWLPVMLPLIVLYVVIGFAMTYVPERNQGVVHLYVVLLLLIVGTVWLTTRTPTPRISALAATALFIATLNFFQPKLVDFQDRSYFDNEDDLRPIAVSYPNHWREMHLEDGRILLNVSPQRRYGGSVRMIADQNKIKSPISLSASQERDDSVIFDVYTPLATNGTWGWRDRPEAVFHLPILGSVQIPKLRNTYAGKALLLDASGQVECRYLYEAKEEPVPATAPGKHVVWTLQRRLEVPSVVECSE